jgi:8-oxo-dGTP diphosphatase
VAGGVVLDTEGSVLLVENRRRNGALDWSTPGGVVDEGETFVEALTREVEEETGLRVPDWDGPMYRVEVTAIELGFFLEVEAHLAMSTRGSIRVDDPDGIVLSAEFLSLEAAAVRLADSAPFVREPLLDHLHGRAVDGRTFRYRIAGAGDDRRVERLD